MSAGIDLNPRHHFRDGLYMREMTLPARHEVQTHKHNFDHVSFITKGRAIVTVDGQQTTLDGPDCILIRANTVHKIEALTNVTWYCLHQTDVTDVALIDHELIKEDEACHGE